MTTAELITAALQRLLVIERGTVPAGDDMQTGLDRLNDMIESWQTERMTTYIQKRYTWTMVSNQASYTVGAGAEIDIPRPLLPQDITVKVRDTSQSLPPELNLNNLTDDAWAQVPIKNLTSIYPTAYYYSPTYDTTGYGTLTFWLVPTSSTLEGVIYYREPISTLSLYDTIYLPPGYTRALRDNLALELAADYSVNPSPSLIASANEAKGNIKRANTRFADLQCDAAVTNQSKPFYNIFVGP